MFAATFAVCLLVYSQLSMARGMGRLVSYDRTIVFANSSGKLPEWAVYDANAKVRGSVSALTSAVDDAEVLDPLDFCIPFFGSVRRPTSLVSSAADFEGKRPIFISPNGLLEFSPVSKCSYFCKSKEADGAQNTDGGYSFSERNPDDGDFPLIGVYVTDLNPVWDSRFLPKPADPLASQVFKWKGVKQYKTSSNSNTTESINAAIVDWNGVHGFRSGNPASYLLQGGNLTAQVELWDNGTVIIRFQMVLTVPVQHVGVEMQNGIEVNYITNVTAGTGLIWSKLMRSVAPDNTISAKTLRPQIAAIRFDPIYEERCAPMGDCEACMSANCSWCGTISACLPSDIISEFCGKMTAVNECEIPSFVNGTTEQLVIPQRWYNTSIAAVNVSTFYVDISTHPDSELSKSASNRIIDFKRANMKFPYFYFPPPLDTNYSTNRTNNTAVVKQSSNGTVHLVTQVGIEASFVVNVTTDSMCYSPPTANDTDSSTVFDAVTASYLTKCEAYDLAFSIAPMGKDVLSFGSKTVQYTLLLPERPAGDYLCEPHHHHYAEDGNLMAGAAITANASLYCPATFVLQVQSAIVKFRPTETVASFQVLLYGDGTVEIFYDSIFSLEGLRDAFPTVYGKYLGPTIASNTTCSLYPAEWLQGTPPNSGLLKRGANDPSSVLVPWQQVSSQSLFRAVPLWQSSCLDCNDRGFCDASTRECVCKEGFEGPQCDQCAAGYYGSKCTVCKTCLHGSCQDGSDGNGQCECTAPYSGHNCSITCSDAISVTRCKGGCGLSGYCLCGQCVCDTDAGWYGERCERWADPCRRYSLETCSACVRVATVSCDWCASSFLCVASEEQEFPIGNRSTIAKTCPDLILGQRVGLGLQLCSSQLGRPTNRVSVTLIIVIVVLAFFTASSSLIVAAVCFCRKKVPNLMVESALPGVPDFKFPRRDREIVGLTRIPVQGRRGKPVQGIPLKQIPMDQLIELQKLKRRTAAKFSPRSERNNSSFHALWDSPTYEDVDVTD